MVFCGRACPLCLVAVVTIVATSVVTAACGQPKSPSTDDACSGDQDCMSGLTCCHAAMEAPNVDMTRMNARGFCVKQSVCLNVVVPGQAPSVPE